MLGEAVTVHVMVKVEPVSMYWRSLGVMESTRGGADRRNVSNDTDTCYCLPCTTTLAKLEMAVT